MNKHTEKKIRNYFERSRNIYDSYNGNYDDFLFEVRKRWRLKHIEEFPDFDQFIDEMTKEEDEAGNDSSAELEQSDIKTVIEEEYLKVDYLTDELNKLFKTWMHDQLKGEEVNSEDRGGKERHLWLESKAITDFHKGLVDFKDFIEKKYRTQL
jgi:hypothetical protein